MSFDLFVFERRSCINTSLDIFSYQEKFTEYTEDKDYNSLNGCSDVISSWAKKMFEKFPPMNGEYAPSDEIAYATEESENHLTDYSLGKHGVYCAFSYSVAEEALVYIKSIADEYKVGFYDIQSNDAIFGKGIEILKYRTESHGDTMGDLDNIEGVIDTLDSIERGTTNRENAFITIWFETDEVESNYIQASPYYKSKGFFKNIFHKNKSNDIFGYFFEIEKDSALYQTLIEDKNELKEVVRAWCIDRKEPDISKYKKILDW